MLLSFMISSLESGSFAADQFAFNNNDFTINLNLNAEFPNIERKSSFPSRKKLREESDHARHASCPVFLV